MLFFSNGFPAFALVHWYAEVMKFEKIIFNLNSSLWMRRLPLSDINHIENSMLCKTILLNGFLHDFQKFFSHTIATGHIFIHSWVSPVLGWGSKVPCPMTLLWKTQRIHCVLKPWPLGHESYFSPLSHWCCGLVGRGSGSWRGGHGRKSLRLVVVAFLFGAQDYGNSTMNGPSLSG